MKRKLIKRNKQFMSKLLKGKLIGIFKGKFVYKQHRFLIHRSKRKPFHPVELNYHMWTYKRNK